MRASATPAAEPVITNQRTSCIVTTEIVYTRASSGSITTMTAADERFWQRYRAGFDQVRVVARVANPNGSGGGGTLVEGDGVTVIAGPPYHGFIGFVCALPFFLLATLRETGRATGVVLRVPGLVSVPAFVAAIVRRTPIAVEVCGDPRMAVSAGRGALGRWLGDAFAWLLRAQLRRAVAVSYVTDGALQNRYPPRARAITASYSSVELPVDAIRAKDVADLHDPARLVTVASMDSRQKGIDTVLDAVDSLGRRNITVELTVVGDGRHRHEYEALARRVTSTSGARIRFLGWLPAGVAVFDQLAAADLYVTASRQEGLPRAVIEAMAHGLPVVATDVGGTSELIDREGLVNTDDPSGLANAIERMLTDRTLRSRLARANRQRAERYDEAALRERRTAFYRSFLELCSTR